MWREWDLYTRTGGPVEFAAKRLAEWKEAVLKRISDSRMKPETRDRWNGEVERAAAPPLVAAPTLARRYERPDDGPTWRGLDENEPERRIRGLFWCHKAGRWAIRIQTSRGNYVNTNTHALSWGRLACEIDHMKCALVLRGFLVIGTKHSSWNAVDLAKERLGCESADLDQENPLHAHLLAWLQRCDQRDEENALAERRGCLPISLHACR
jgi:hypothetical protein